MHGHKTSHLPIRYFLALLWAHPILHISRIRVNHEGVRYVIFSNVLFVPPSQAQAYTKHPALSHPQPMSFVREKKIQIDTK